MSKSNAAKSARKKLAAKVSLPENKEFLMSLSDKIPETKPEGVHLRVDLASYAFGALMKSVVLVQEWVSRYDNLDNLDEKEAAHINDMSGLNDAFQTIYALQEALKTQVRAVETEIFYEIRGDGQTKTQKTRDSAAPRTKESEARDLKNLAVATNRFVAKNPNPQEGTAGSKNRRDQFLRSTVKRAAKALGSDGNRALRHILGYLVMLAAEKYALAESVWCVIDGDAFFGFPEHHTRDDQWVLVVVSSDGDASGFGVVGGKDSRMIHITKAYLHYVRGGGTQQALQLVGLDSRLVFEQTIAALCPNLFATLRHQGFLHLLIVSERERQQLANRWEQKNKIAITLLWKCSLVVSVLYLRHGELNGHGNEQVQNQNGELTTVPFPQQTRRLDAFLVGKTFDDRAKKATLKHAAVYGKQQSADGTLENSWWDNLLSEPMKFIRTVLTGVLSSLSLREGPDTMSAFLEETLKSFFELEALPVVKSMVDENVRVKAKPRFDLKNAKDLTQGPLQEAVIAAREQQQKNSKPSIHSRDGNQGNQFDLLRPKNIDKTKKKPTKKKSKAAIKKKKEQPTQSATTKKEERVGERDELKEEDQPTKKKPARGTSRRERKASMQANSWLSLPEDSKNDNGDDEYDIDDYDDEFDEGYDGDDYNDLDIDDDDEFDERDYGDDYFEDYDDYFEDYDDSDSDYREKSKRRSGRKNNNNNNNVKKKEKKKKKQTQKKRGNTTKAGVKKLAKKLRMTAEKCKDGEKDGNSTDPAKKKNRLESKMPHRRHNVGGMSRLPPSTDVLNLTELNVERITVVTSMAADMTRRLVTQSGVNLPPIANTAFWQCLIAWIGAKVKGEKAKQDKLVQCKGTTVTFCYSSGDAKRSVKWERGIEGSFAFDEFWEKAKASLLKDDPLAKKHLDSGSTAVVCSEPNSKDNIVAQLCKDHYQTLRSHFIDTLCIYLGMQIRKLTDDEEVQARLTNARLLYHLGLAGTVETFTDATDLDNAEDKPEDETTTKETWEPKDWDAIYADQDQKRLNATQITELQTILLEKAPQLATELLQDLYQECDLRPEPTKPPQWQDFLQLFSNKSWKDQSATDKQKENKKLKEKKKEKSFDAFNGKEMTALLAKAIMSMRTRLQKADVSLFRKWLPALQKLGRVKLSNTVLENSKHSRPKATYQLASLTEREKLDFSKEWDTAGKNKEQREAVRDKELSLSKYQVEIEKAFKAILGNLMQENFQNIATKEWPELGKEILRAKQRTLLETWREGNYQSPKPEIPTGTKGLEMIVKSASLLDAKVACIRLALRVLKGFQHMDQAFGVITDGVSLSVYGARRKKNARTKAMVKEELATNRNNLHAYFTATQGYESFWKDDLFEAEMKHLGVTDEIVITRVKKELQRPASFRKNAQARGTVDVDDLLAAGFKFDHSNNFFVDQGQVLIAAWVQLISTTEDKVKVQRGRLTGKHAHQISGQNRAQREAEGKHPTQVQRNLREADEKMGADWKSIPELPHVPLAAQKEDAEQRNDHDQGLVDTAMHLVRILRTNADKQDAKKDVVLFWGKEGISSSSSKGARVFGTKTLLRILQDHFLVVLVPEYNTSQLCPRCVGRLKFAQKGNWRRKQCSDCNVKAKEQGVKSWKFRCDRDTAAAVNLLHIVDFMIRNKDHRRPAAFSPSEKHG